MGVFVTTRKRVPQIFKRKIYRHSSNEGSVIEFDFYGTPMKMFVADAKYRSNGKHYGQYQVDLPLKGFLIEGYINPSDIGDDQSSALTYNLTDQELQDRFPSFSTVETAKAATDILMQYDDTDAAHHCRAQVIDSVGALDLPNIYELIILYLESDNIDALDPSADDHPELKLGCTNPNGRFNGNSAWASTEYDLNSSRVVMKTGDANHLFKNEDLISVYPILEV